MVHIQDKCLLGMAEHCSAQKIL